MKVILTQSVPKIGAKDTVVNVADGYARNYLFPRSLAVLAERRQVEALDKRKARDAAKSAGDLSTAQELGERLNGGAIRIPGQLGPQGKLRGAITAQMVVDAINEQLGAKLERKQLGHIDPIKRLGEYPVALDLYTGVHASVALSVYDPTAPVAAPVAPEPEVDETDGPDFE